MKLLIGLSLCLSCSLGHASVDYVAIGSLLKASNKEITNAKKGFACLIKDYANKTTCEKIENLNVQSRNLLNEGYSYFNYSCSTYSSKSSESVGFLKNRAEKLRRMAHEAQDTDAVWAIIEKYERAIEQLSTDVKKVMKDARIQEVYTSQCLFEVEPDDGSVLERICKNQ